MLPPFCGSLNKIILIDEVASSPGLGLDPCIASAAKPGKEKPVETVLDTDLESSVLSCYEVK